MNRLKWKCSHCGHKNKWKWEKFDRPDYGKSNWFCDKCCKVSIFEMYEKREGEWRRKRDPV